MSETNSNGPTLRLRRAPDHFIKPPDKIAPPKLRKPVTPETEVKVVAPDKVKVPNKKKADQAPATSPASNPPPPATT